jgi:hydroxypyruvate reductase
LSVIVSDTNPGEESAVASGPTFAPPEDAPDARDVIQHYQLEKSLPSSILRVFKEASNLNIKTHSLQDARHFLLLDNRSVIEAASRAARARGFVVRVASDLIEQPIEEGCAELISRLRQGKAENSNEVFCLISGGEFACPVLGEGVGGRNQETVLRCALALDERRRQGDAVFNSSRTVILSAGTDGIDGNSPAAGAICDETTIERARALKLDARRSLEQSDAHTFFHALNDAFITGPTGTNVRDLRIMLAL